MKNSLVLSLLILLSVHLYSQKSAKLVDYVNPLIGTDTWQSDVPVAGHEDPSGYTFPGVTEPFGMTEWTAHTMASKEKGSIHHRVPYWYSHSYISGFLGTHYPSGAVMFDYGAVELMPIVGKFAFRPEDRSSSFRHSSEVSKPHFYEVMLDDYNVKVQMSATKAAGIMEFTFPKSDSSFVIIDAMPSLFTAGAPASIVIDPTKREIRGKSAVSARGYRESGYFVIRFDKEFSSFGTFNQNLDYPEAIEEKYLFSEVNGKLVNGLKGTYLQNSQAFGHLKSVRIDPVVDFDWDWYKPADDFLFNDYQVSWEGKLKAPVSGEYLLGVQADDGARLYINGKRVIDAWGPTGFSYKPTQVALTLEAGKMYDIKLDYYQKEWSSRVKLSWIIPDKKSKEYVIWGNQELSNSTKMGAFVHFTTTKGEVVKALIGTSFISEEQARANLDREIGRKSLQKVAQMTESKWEKELRMVELPDATSMQKESFYTAMYHSLLLPRSLSENGIYRSPFDGKVYEGESFTDYSLWDTFRATHPFITLMKPETAGHLVTGLLNGFDQGGWMPKWPNPGYTNCMMGTHGDAVIADAFAKGVTNFDIQKAEQAMMKNAYQKGNYIAWGRLGIEDYIRLGYVPTDKYNESVARTMEFAYDDYCIATFLQKIGKKEKANEFFGRSLYFKNVLDPETKMVRGKKSDRQWCDPNDYAISVWSGFSPKGVYNYKKNYTLFAPHAIGDLIDFLGGNEPFASYLDEIFENDIYYVGDEFVMHAPFLYNYCGKPWMTQKRVRDIVKNYYANTPGGLPGNDDCGQLSSWYMFAAMGFYPVCPGSTTYQITTPSLPSAVLNLPNGKTFKIKTINYSDENIYIKSVKINGEISSSTELDHSQIMKGGEIIFELDRVPHPTFFKGN